MTRENLADRSFDIRRVCHVQRDRLTSAAPVGNLTRDRLCMIAAGGSHDDRTPRRQLARHRAANPSRGTGDECHPA
jgi:hypothetical protein